MAALLNSSFEILAWGVGWPEIVVILVLTLILFGGKKLPELAQGMAKGLKTFKKEMRGGEGEVKDVKDAVQTNLTPEADKDKDKNDEKTPSQA